MPASKPDTLFKSTLIVSATLFAARLLGFARESALAATYGAGEISDAFIIAYTIPTIFLGFLSTSAVSAYIPMYHRVDKKADFMSNLLTCFALLGLLLSVLLSLFPGAFTWLFASRLEARSFAVASGFVRLMAWTSIPVLLSDILRSYLQIQGAFFSAGVSGALVSIVVIAGILLPGGAEAGFVLGVAPVIGGALCMLFLLLACARSGYRYRPVFAPSAPELRELLLLASPMLISTAIGELNQIIDRNFASSLAAGSIASLNYANKVAGIAITLIGSALFTVLFPKMSELFSNGDVGKIKGMLLRAVIAMVLVLLPVTIGAVILAEPIVRILFERGSFTARDTLITAQCLRMYALLIVTNSVNALVIRVFYSMHDTKLPAIVSALAVAVNIALNLLLIGPMKHQGLALSTAAAAALSTALLLLLLRKKIGPIGLFKERAELLKIAAASGATGAAALLVKPFLPFASAGLWGNLFWCAVLSAFAALAYVCLLALLRCRALLGIVRRLRPRQT